MAEVEDKDVMSDVEVQIEGPGVYVDEKGEVVEKEADSISPQEEEEQDEEDESPRQSQSEQSELEQASTDEERESIRARRREEKKIRRERQRERSQAKDRLISSLQQQNQDLSSRLAQIERRQVGGDFARLESDLAEAVQTAREAKEHLEKAATDGDGKAVADATELYYAARRKAEHLNSIRQNIIKSSSQTRAPQVDPEMTRKASSWLSKHPWYNSDGNEEDSKIARVVDDQLAAEGFDPRTSEYWEELDERLARRLPHRYASNGKRPTGRSPVAGSGKESGGGNVPSSGKQFYLSPERVKAMKDSGIWDDPKRRAEMIAKYKEYDKQHTTARR